MTDGSDFGSGVLVALSPTAWRTGWTAAAYLWLAADGPRSRGALLDAVVAALGPHPEAGTLVDDALAVLAEAGIMVAGPPAR